MTFFLFISFANYVNAEDTLNDEQLIKTFNRIIKSDQSNLKHPEIRAEIFKTNFNTILSIIKSQGFPSLEGNYKRSKKKYVIRRASQTTFIHILQTAPTLLLNRFVIDLLNRELTQNRMDKQLIEAPLWVFKYDREMGRSEPWDESLTEQYAYAMRVWDISERE